MKVSKQSKASGTAPSSTRKGGNVIAGGAGSRVINPQGTRDGQKAFGVSPRGVSQIGYAIGNHVTEGQTRLPYKGEQWLEKPPISVPLGNQIATNVGKGGPGVGREVFKCGSQGTCGPTRDPNATGRDTLAEFGPDTSNARKPAITANQRKEYEHARRSTD
jgi:hypothetical protein